MFPQQPTRLVLCHKSSADLTSIVFDSHYLHVESAQSWSPTQENSSSSTNCPSARDIPRTFTRAASRSFPSILYGPLQANCKDCGPYYSHCVNWHTINAMKLGPQPKRPMLVKDETFRFIFEDRLGTLHTSELQSDDNALPYSKGVGTVWLREVEGSGEKFRQEAPYSAASSQLPTSFPA